ncbi:MAG: cytochrome c3 family protein [Deltaproteobacteria bacterium]|nr:cytochrome c3 family protein [Deltaproteobacteria bacterium]
MKKRIVTVICMALSGMIFLAVGALTAADVPDIPENVTIENDGYKRDKKGHVKLSHKKHSGDYGSKCTDCHHEYNDGKNVWAEGNPVKKCSECHDPLKKKNKKQYKLQNAYHKNCKNCHKTVNKAGKKAPYKKCNNCHQKKSKK